jgi:hypothetical protein
VNYQEQIATADVAIKAAQDLGMGEVAAQIIAKRAWLMRRARASVDFVVEYHVVSRERLPNAKVIAPTTLPITSIRDEVRWFKRGMSGVHVQTIRWGDPAEGRRLRVMVSGKDPLNGDLMRGYIYPVSRETVQCPKEGVR